MTTKTRSVPRVTAKVTCESCKRFFGFQRSDGSGPDMGEHCDARNPVCPVRLRLKFTIKYSR